MRVAYTIILSAWFAIASVAACSPSSGKGAPQTDGGGSSSSGGGSGGSSGSSSGGGGTPTTLATGQKNPGGIASNGSKVVWTTNDATMTGGNLNGTGEIMAVSPSGGTPTPLVSSVDNAAVVAIDSTYAYWFGANDNTISKVPLAGGAATAIENNLDNSIYEMVIDSTSVYWANVLDAIRSAPLTGAKNTLLASLGDAGFNAQYQTQDIAVSSAGVFAMTPTSILIVPLGGGSFSTLATGQTPGAIVADATSVYWANASGIMKVAVGGGTPAQLAALTAGVAFMAVDADSVYWIELGGSVKKVPLAGGTAVALAAAPLLPGGLAVDATNVYWTDPNGGNVYEIAK
jgi:hypothetical protein